MFVRKCLRKTSAFTAGLIAAKFAAHGVPHCNEPSKKYTWKKDNLLSVPDVLLPKVFANGPHELSEKIVQALQLLKDETGIEIPPHLVQTPYREFVICFDTARKLPALTYQYMDKENFFVDWSEFNGIVAWIPEKRLGFKDNPAFQNIIKKQDHFVIMQLVCPLDYATALAQRQTHYITNVVPMESDAYNTRWVPLLEKVRDFYSNDCVDGVHVFSGPYYKKAADDASAPKLKTGQHIPDGFFKLIIVQKRDVNTGNWIFQVIPNVFENKFRAESYTSSLDCLDELTGFNWSKQYKKG